MRRFAVIVEGKGDVASVPALISKTGSAFGLHLVPSLPPIRAGEVRKLQRTGELERHLELAASREDVQDVILLVDLDDDCAKQVYEDFNKRAEPLRARTGKRIEICFCVREYEAWFLSDIVGISERLPEFGIDPSGLKVDPETVRAAKETLRKLCKEKNYKQMRDQLVFTKKINVMNLYKSNRSFKKLVKAITNKNYRDIEEIYFT